LRIKEEDSPHPEKNGTGKQNGALELKGEISQDEKTEWLILKNNLWL
jgi:hypothetical protein